MFHRALRNTTHPRSQKPVKIMCKIGSFRIHLPAIVSLGTLSLAPFLISCSDIHLNQGSVDSNAVVCWGDSMTAGNEGIVNQGEYPAILHQYIRHKVINEGVGGETSSQIGVRQGGIPTYVTVDGGVIPSRGGVTISFKRGYEPLTSPRGSTRGSILGVEGTVTLSAALPNGTFTFTRTSSGASVPATDTPQFIPDTPYAGYVSVFWEGRNNLLKTAVGPWGPDQIMSDLAAQVALVPQGKTYLVLSVLNENGPTERRGSTNYQTLMRLNDALATMYGEQYLDIRTILVNSYNASLPTDVSDFENDMPPTSLGAICARGTLTSDIGKTDGTFSVNVTSGTLRGYSNLVIDGESIHVITVDGSRVTSAIRGFGGTAASHSAGTTATDYDGVHLNKDGDVIVATAVAAKLAKLAASSTTVGSAP